MLKGICQHADNTGQINEPIPTSAKFSMLCEYMLCWSTRMFRRFRQRHDLLSGLAMKICIYDHDYCFPLASERCSVFHLMLAPEPRYASPFTQDYNNRTALGKISEIVAYTHQTDLYQRVGVFAIFRTKPNFRTV